MRTIAQKVAFVTGGGSGIGLGIARRLLANGASVMIADLRADHLAEARELLMASDRVDFIQVDVVDRSAMAAAAQTTVERFGKVHIVVNNAGVGTTPSIQQMTYADWDWVLAVNLGGTINGIMSFLPHLLAQAEGGHILSTASMAALLPTPNNFIYAASKYAVRGLSDSLRLTLAPHRIGVSVLYPGLTRSRMLKSEENRQSRFTRAAPVDQPPGPVVPPPDAGMDPLEIGDIVVQGILNNAAYILSHGEFREELGEHFSEILQAFPRAQSIDPGRLLLEEARRSQTAAARAAIAAMNASEAPPQG